MPVSPQTPLRAAGHTQRGAERATQSSNVRGSPKTKRRFELQRGAEDTQALSRQITQKITQLDNQGAKIDQLIRRAEGSRQLAGRELLALQARVYLYSQKLEFISRVVDRTVSAAKTALSMQI